MNKYLRPFYYYWNARNLSKKVYLSDLKLKRSGILFSDGYVDLGNIDISALKNIFFEKKIMFSTLQQAMKIDEIINKIKPYLNELFGDEFIIENFIYHRLDASTSYENVSASWHTDQIGERVKLFICLNGQGGYPTYIMPGTSQKRFKSGLLEQFRFIGYKIESHKTNEVVCRHRTGSCIAFNTNFYHRANRYSNEQEVREILEIDFSDKDKAENFRHLAPIGPSILSESNIFFQKDFFEGFQNKKLLNDNWIHHEGDVWKYGVIEKNFHRLRFQEKTNMGVY